MKRLSGRSLACRRRAAAACPGATRADFYSNWSFSWNFNPVGTALPGFVPANSPAATGGAQFAAQSGTNGDGTIPVATVTTTSSAGGTVPPDSFKKVPFTFGVTITDNATKATGTLTFDGVVNGNRLTRTSSDVSAHFSLDPGSPTSLALSGHTYRVKVRPDLALPAPKALPKLLDAAVTVGPAGTGGGNNGNGNGKGGGGGGTAQSAPEPSAFALAGIAAATFALARRRRV
jgi:PEP-CTERM motif